MKELKLRFNCCYRDLNLFIFSEFFQKSKKIY